MTKKKRNKGVKGSGCAHDKWLVRDTETEFGEVLICTQCEAIMPKVDWIALHTHPKAKKGIDLFDAGVIYFAVYAGLLIAYFLLGGND